MLLRGLSITGDVFNISVKDLAVLYEYWCFIKLNRIMKDKYELLSQNIIKAQGNGLFVSLIKGSGSTVKYRNPINGEIIILSYNSKGTSAPTVSQRPDNILTLTKKGSKVKYYYVFDAKHRINPALSGTDYANQISSMPGPEVDDINTMHRYRDAIVYKNGADPTYERTMFGAYVLFPYSNEEEYRHHRFYKSIAKVNIGGLPFLPTATKLTTQMLEELISDSPDSAFERATLPVGIEDKIAKVDWSVRDVLVGSLRNIEQLKTCVDHKFYHIPCTELEKDDFPIRSIAIYQSKHYFGENAGIQYFGEVLNYRVVNRNEITEIPKNTNKPYYRFEIKSWKVLPHLIKAKEMAGPHFFTNMFLLQHGTEIPDLMLRSEEEYRLFTELRRVVKSAIVEEQKDKALGFRFGSKKIVIDDENFLVISDHKVEDRVRISDFAKAPRATFNRIQRSWNK